jgi:hypothetical protein
MCRDMVDRREIVCRCCTMSIADLVPVAQQAKLQFRGRVDVICQTAFKMRASRQNRSTPSRCARILVDFGKARRYKLHLHKFFAAIKVTFFLLSLPSALAQSPQSAFPQS